MARRGSMGAARCSTDGGAAGAGAGKAAGQGMAGDRPGAQGPAGGDAARPPRAEAPRRGRGGSGGGADPSGGAPRGPAEDPIRVVIVDDSSVMRQMLRAALAADRRIEVAGLASDPYEAREVIRATSPDVVTLDVEMPRMNGLEFLGLIMKLRPIPVVMVASSTVSGTEATLQALEAGAVDVIGKPSGPAGWDGFAASFRRKVRAAATARLRLPGALDGAAGPPSPPAPRRAAPQPASPLPPPAPVMPRPAGEAREAAVPGLGPAPAPGDAPQPGTAGELDRALARCRLIAVGASTGGVAAIHRLLRGAGRAGPPLVIAQHMAAAFTGRFAGRLARTLGIDAAEAADDETLRPGTIRIAPGDRHLRIERRGRALVCRIGDDDPVGGHRPSVDLLFGSVAEAAAGGAVGIILTGMGRDGAAGLARMRAAGAYTIGEAEASCTVYGMPRAAREAGAVCAELELDRIARHLRTRFGSPPAPETSWQNPG